MNSGLYRKLNLELLSDGKVQRKLSRDPTSIFQEKFQLLLKDAVSEGVFDQNLAEKLLVPCPTVPTLHSLPKYHKMRPIVSGIGALGELFGVSIDHHLQPLVSAIPGYLRETLGINSRWFSLVDQFKLAVVRRSKSISIYTPGYCCSYVVNIFG